MPGLTYTFPDGQPETIQKAIELLRATPAGQKALASLMEGLLEFGEEVSNHVFPDKRGDQAQAFCDLVVIAITYGLTEDVFIAIREQMRK